MNKVELASMNNVELANMNKVELASINTVELGQHDFTIRISEVHQPFQISICISTLPTQHTTFIEQL